jgi:hypothetical protein
MTWAMGTVYASRSSCETLKVGETTGVIVKGAALVPGRSSSLKLTQARLTRLRPVYNRRE